MECYCLVGQTRAGLGPCDQGMGMSSQISAALSGADKAALVLLALGSDRSAALLSGLEPEQTARLSEHLSRLADIDSTTRQRVLEEFRQAVVRSPFEGTDPAPPSPEKARNEGRADRAATTAGGVRKLDLTRLERVPRSVAKAAPTSTPQPLAALPENLAVECRAELAALRLPVSALGDLAVGDVLLLKPGSDARVELVGGEGCHLAGTLRDIGGQRAVEILADVTAEEKADDPAA